MFLNMFKSSLLSESRQLNKFLYKQNKPACLPERLRNHRMLVGIIMLAKIYFAPF